MRAELRDLKGKYYGTEVEIFDNDGKSAGYVVIWLNPTTQESWVASKRELDDWDEEEYGEYSYDDNHYETTIAYNVAQLLVKAGNEA